MQNDTVFEWEAVGAPRKCLLYQQKSQGHEAGYQECLLYGLYVIFSNSYENIRSLC